VNSWRLSKLTARIGKTVSDAKGAKAEPDEISALEEGFRKAMDDEISTMQQREDLTPSQKMEQKSGIENKYRQNANTYAEDEWTKSHNGQPWKGTQTATCSKVIDYRTDICIMGWFLCLPLFFF